MNFINAEVPESENFTFVARIADKGTQIQDSDNTLSLLGALGSGKLTYVARIVANQPYVVIELRK